MSYQVSSYQAAMPQSRKNSALFGNTYLPPPQVAALPATFQQPQNAYYPYYSPIMSGPGVTPWLPSGPVQTAAGPLAQTLPLVQQLPPLPYVPPPTELSPCLFSNHIPYGYGYTPPNATGFYNYNWNPYYTWGQYPPQYPQQNPGAQNLSPQTPPQPPPPQAEQNKPKEPQQQTPPIPPSLLLTPEIIQELNRMLESSDYNIRMEASKKLAHIMDADPDILAKPQFSKYAEALILKALRDPSSIVHQPLLISMEASSLTAPTAAIIAELSKLKKKKGLYNFEPGIIENILNNFRVKQTQAQMNMPKQGLGNPEPQRQMAVQGNGQAVSPGVQPVADPIAGGGGNVPFAPPAQSLMPAQRTDPGSQLPGQPGPTWQVGAQGATGFRNQPGPAWQAGPQGAAGFRNQPGPAWQAGPQGAAGFQNQPRLPAYPGRPYPVPMQADRQNQNNIMPFPYARQSVPEQQQRKLNLVSTAG